MRKALITTLALMALGTGSALGAGITSAYTDIDLDDCDIVNADDFGATWECQGYEGRPIRVSEGDLRFSLRYGSEAGGDSVYASGQTLPPFNTLGPRIEWRLEDGEPFATIVRYFTARPDGEPGPEGQVLVVTQLVEGNTCHIAYVDARANPDPNALAREAADNSGDFDCESDEIDYVGDFTAWTP